MESPLLDIAGVRVGFPDAMDGRIEVLRGVDLSLWPGEICGLVGANGAGKTTLLKVIAGSLAPEQGRVTIGGLDVTHMPQYVRARDVSYVDQDSYKALVGPLTVGEVLALAARRGKRLRSWVRGLDEPLAEVGHWSQWVADLLRTLAKRPTSVLSGGQRQVLGIAACVLGRPRVFLLDEHLASLDEEHSAEVSRLLGAYIKERQATAIMVSHDLEWVKLHVRLLVRLTDGHAERV